MFNYNCFSCVYSGLDYNATGCWDISAETEDLTSSTVTDFDGCLQQGYITEANQTSMLGDLYQNDYQLEVKCTQPNEEVLIVLNNNMTQNINSVSSVFSSGSPHGVFQGYLAASCSMSSNCNLGSFESQG